ncbi:hypothetical protein PPYR_06262 [Photinus pyralis]|uniref:G-protein coupled receptors family 1 profile domain-containing protein n=1 Tax=Photinus pyralis TaxID=7054 RepID=A0A5N4AT27_PHOPY|nr:pyrokinin-1 receptor-like isoform X2 [Photinus pyralis]KAB0800522.1 hypothetical protein PPYR_06262 [Photinus pyralis]
MTFWNTSITILNDTITNSTLYTTEITNVTGGESLLYPVSLVIPITVIYVVIFFTGIIGNVSTCIVIARSKSLHTATNYYLFSLAISDLLLLVSGLPPEMYRLWSPETYVFGGAFCILQGFAAETSANATVLTITAFTVERYLAICHPFLSHTMSKLSRAIKYVIAIWVIALCLAAPQAMQFGVEYDKSDDGVERSRCTVVSTEFYFQHAFEISTFVFFVGPMTLITVLYILIGIKLRNARTLSIQRSETSCNGNGHASVIPRVPRNTAAQQRVIKMLVAVVVAFFICWAPFHAQRLLAVYLTSATPEDQATFIKLYIVLMYTSGVLYFVSTTVNPVLYHIMSKKFREAFKATFSQLCGSRSSRRFDRHTYSSLLRQQQSIKHFRNASPDAENDSPNLPNFHCRGRIDLHNRNVPLEQADHLCAPNELTLSRPCHPTFRPRVASDTSQVTVLSNLSRKSTVNERKAERILMQRSVSTVHKPHFMKNSSIQYRRNQKRNILTYGMFRLFSKEKRRECSSFLRQGSDMDENEFNASDLSNYMEEINKELT